MTREESKILKRKLKKLGYKIKTGYSDPDMWAVDINFEVDEENNVVTNYCNGSLNIVDCSYDNLSLIKYRKRLYGTFETAFVYKRLENCTVQEVLDNIDEISLQIKKYKIEAEIENAGRDFI